MKTSTIGDEREVEEATQNSVKTAGTTTSTNSVVSDSASSSGESKQRSKRKHSQSSSSSSSSFASIEAEQPSKKKGNHTTKFTPMQDNKPSAQMGMKGEWTGEGQFATEEWERKNETGGVGIAAAAAPRADKEADKGEAKEGVAEKKRRTPTPDLEEDAMSEEALPSTEPSVPSPPKTPHSPLAPPLPSTEPSAPYSHPKTPHSPPDPIHSSPPARHTYLTKASSPSVPPVSTPTLAPSPVSTPDSTTSKINAEMLCEKKPIFTIQQLLSLANERKAQSQSNLTLEQLKQQAREKARASHSTAKQTKRRTGRKSRNRKRPTAPKNEDEVDEPMEKVIMETGTLYLFRGEKPRAKWTWKGIR